MSVMNICRLEKSTWNLKDVSLRQPCRELTPSDIMSDWFRSLLADMYETLYSTPSGIGLAAPQVGLQLQLVVIDIKRDSRKPLVLINPSYVGVGKQMKISTESCLSVPGVTGQVMRYEQICVKYIDIHGDYVERECNGFEAIAIQHEIDHINGIVYVDKLIDGSHITPTEGHIRRLADKTIKTIYEKTERM